VDEDDEPEVDFQEEVDKFSKFEAIGMDTNAGTTAPTPSARKNALSAKSLGNPVLEMSVRAKVLE
jgi:hypothetical protein